MADKLEAEAALFRKAAEKTGDVRDKINGVLDTLKANLDSRGTPWGTDSIGSQFAHGEGGEGGYLDSRKNMVEGAQNVAGTMDSFHQGQVKSAAYLEKMEQQNRDGFQ
ncbi:hypothetical protein BJY24_001730 [Nocardia transvalensis]|uniref:WXG100 family type VII secretion target n=1 Tax=Nocardia transvalensis TaxID=37333 RepID=A0A7W9PBZ0_9NOCA|nr:hypothetical protein [Nocardia transvalensis]MBB5912863.1 hypothetical protein [Nocardia transvalensis]